MTVTNNGEYITMEDGNTAFYEFQNGMAVIKFNGRDDCYLLFLNTDTVTELSTRHIQSRIEKLVPVKRINNYVDRTVIVRLVELPVEVQSMCADGNVYMTKSDQTGGSRLGRRRDDEAASFFTDCSYFCFSSTECHYVCFV
ncbi:uncharacterized protein LOC132733196 [Ruditapes philippinarum]|uniref:uncharacterized protein LOC132733196 n=1 Tax=Ruditapes philippinarum TaxID=129788 RepID=UPI00295ABE09|nr:uncharacterized protein LOC132733196 [Ruditapes philippinarum]